MDSNCTVTPKPKSVKEFFKSWYFWKPFLSVSIGGLGGFLYYYFNTVYKRYHLTEHFDTTLLVC